MPIWGVDSYSPAHRSARGTHGESLFDYIVRFLAHNRARFGDVQAPQFWGRYLNRSRPRSSLSSEERDYLLERGVKIALIYNDTCYDQHHDTDCHVRHHGRRVPLALSGYEFGALSAQHACELAADDSVGAPDGTRLYADLEGWYVDPEWLEGWCTEVPDQARRFGKRYSAGIYGRVLTGSELAYARRSLPQDVWSISIEGAMRERQRRDDLSAGGFSRRTAGPRTNTSRQLSQEAAAPPPRSPRSHVWVWSNMPRWTSRCNGMPDGFEANTTAGGLTTTVVWQYGMACPNLGGLVDMDLARQEGIDEMWGPTAS